MTLTVDEIENLVRDEIRDHLKRNFDAHVDEWHTRGGPGIYSRTEPGESLCSAMKENSSIVHIEKSYLHRLQEKAQKWDESVKKQEIGHVYNWNFGSGTMDDVKTWMDKAIKYDSLERHWDENGRCPNYDKAKKWDSYEKYGDSVMKEWQEKAQRYNNLIQAMAHLVEQDKNEEGKLS